MRKDIQKATATIANFLPGLISGAQVEFFSRTNITNSQFIILMAIFRAKKCNMGYLTKRLHVTMPTVTGLIDRLIKLSLVKRIASEKDRRKVYIELSKKGNVLINGFKGIVRQRWTKLLTALSSSEVDNFRKIFEKLSRNMGSQENARNE